MGKLGKHDHKLTNLLKGGIFSLIMLAPLIAIGVKCLYVINNKNAYESYSEYYIENIEIVNETTMLVQGETYKFTYYNTGNQSYIGDFTYKTISIDWTDYGFTLENINKFRLYGNSYITVYNATNQETINNIWGKTLNSLTIQLETYGSTTDQKLSEKYGNTIITMVLTEKGTLDNVFEYSVKQLENQSTFNWVQNTAIYVPLNAMCSGLGITESAIPILLCYWSLMTAIYIVFDIIIYLFTKMTHFIGTN